MSSRNGKSDIGCALVIVVFILCYTAYQIAELVVKSNQQTVATTKDTGR